MSARYGFNYMMCAAKPRGGLNSNDEREQTLNQLLTELDGFDSAGSAGTDLFEPLLVITATNRLEDIDSALRRPGRFDRVVAVELPTESDREDILACHCSKLSAINADVDLADIAARTAGYSGADLALIVVRVVGHGVAGIHAGI